MKRNDGAVTWILCVVAVIYGWYRGGAFGALVNLGTVALFVLVVLISYEFVRDFVQDLRDILRWCLKKVRHSDPKQDQAQTEEQPSLSMQHANVQQLSINQIESLVALMGRRLDQLDQVANGKMIYYVSGFPAPKRTEYFYLDAGILLSLLSVNLTGGINPEAYWMTIITTVCTDRKLPDATEEGFNKLLAVARLYRDKWMQHDRDTRMGIDTQGPLAAVVVAGIAASFQADPGWDEIAQRRILGPVLLECLEDAMSLEKEFHRIIRT